jgi:HemY protein
MLRLILFLIFLIASVYLGLQIIWHPGYLLLVYQPWMVQMPIWFALLSAFIFFILFYILIDSFDRLQFLGFRLMNWLRIRRTSQSYNKTQHGLTLLIEGQYKKAEKLLLDGVNLDHNPLVNYLGAAYAAYHQNALDRQDHHIKKAYQVAPDSDLAIGLTQAELQLFEKKFEQAIATLNRLRQSSPRHPKLLTLLKKAYVRIGDWTNLQLLLPDLYKAKVLTHSQFDQFTKNVYVEIFRSTSPKSREEWQQLYEAMPRDLKSDPDIIECYVKQLIQFSGTELIIETLIRKVMKISWQPELVVLYSTLPFDRLDKQLVIVAAWQKIHGTHPELHFTLARLCVRMSLWGKAKDYFEKCLASGVYPAASLEYGELLEKLDDYDAARQVYREGLKKE